ncbi:MAG: hypothetical protein ABIJ56_16345 [Pseudomonadota bacterium]
MKAVRRTRKKTRTAGKKHPSKGTRAAAKLPPGIEALARHLAKIKKKARKLGIFTNDRELLTCPKCGFLEDVTCDGQLITCKATRLGKDTGLRFTEIIKAAGRLRCPACGSEVTASEDTTP